MDVNLMSYIATCLSALCFVASCIYWLYPWSHRIRLVDIPDHRKIHKLSTPKIGGLVMAVIAMLEIYLWRSNFFMDFRIILSFFILCLFSLIDDLLNLPPLKQFFLQLIAAAIAVSYGHLQVHYLGPIFGNSTLVLSPLLSQVFSIIALVGVINAFNMFDGMNGLLGSFIILLSSLFLALGIFYHQSQVAILASILLGMFLGFMIFNLPNFKKDKNRKIVFMGDIGSSLAGFMVYWIIIKINQSQDIPSLLPISMVWFLALPLMDMLRVMLLRLNFNRPLGQADKLHFHHILIAKKWNNLAIVKLSLLISIFFILIGCLSFYGISGAILFSFFWIVFFLYNYQWNKWL
jgi:UDP-GlcNAc:undecaprenyl-phosphate GlcNAc-1-phosphate transferase